MLWAGCGQQRVAGAFPRSVLMGAEGPAASRLVAGGMGLAVPWEFLQVAGGAMAMPGSPHVPTLWPLLSGHWGKQRMES